MLAVRVESDLIAKNRLAVRFAFPYGSQSMQAADWTQPDKHQSALEIANGRDDGSSNVYIDAERLSPSI